MDDQQAHAGLPQEKKWKGRALVGLAFIVVGVWMLSSRSDPPPPSIAALVYKGAVEEQMIQDPHITLARYNAGEPFDKVVAFYMSLSGFGGRIPGDPTIMTAGIPFFKTWLGFRSTICTGNEPRPTVVSKTLIRQTNNAVYFVYVSSPSTNEPASTVISSFRFAGRTGDTGSLLTGFEYPNASRGSGGQAGAIRSYRYTTKDPLDEVWRYYQIKLGLQTNVAGGTVIAMAKEGKSAGSDRNYVAIFPETNRPNLREKGFLRFENEQAIFVTISRGKDDDKTHVIMNAVAW